MIKLLYIFLLAFVVTNCSFKKVVKHHGVPFLEKKQKSLIVNETTSNDIRQILGAPSTQSKFDNDVWIYIERKQRYKFRLEIFKPIEFSKNENIEFITSHLNQILEVMIKKNPEQWIWTHDRWK